MKIALLNDSFPPIVDGVVNAVMNYARVLTQHGHEVCVAVPAYPDVKDDYPYTVVRYLSLDTTKRYGYRAGFPFSPAAIEQIEAFRPDIIHSHCPICSNFLARTLRGSLHVPVIFTYHTKFDIDIRTAVRGHLLQNELISALVKNVSACDEVWTVSGGAGESLRSIGYKGKYLVMENGVDLPRGRADEAHIRKVEELCALRPGAPVFLFTGRLRWYKGIRMIVEGLSQIMDRADFTMLFVGEGSDRAEIEQLCRDTGLMPRCRFVGAVLDRELLRAFYSRADLFLFPSTFDTNGIVVREAAACGLAALLIRGSCAAEGVTDGVNSLLMDESSASLAEKVLSVCSAPSTMKSLGEGAQRDLYLSWDEAVSRAEIRYGAMLHDFALNPRPPRHDIFPFVSESVDIINRIKNISAKVKELLKSLD